MPPERGLPAPELVVTRWLNTPGELSLAALRGRVVSLYVFQRKCEGCVTQSLPQAREVHETFAHSDVVVIGLHAPFTHAALTDAAALEAFLAEHRLRFPVAMDAEGDGWQPATFAAYAAQGTPTLVLIDRQGSKRFQRLGHVEDLKLGAMLQELVSERE